MAIKGSADNKWYAVYTNPRAEKQVYERLTGSNIEAYLPLKKTVRQWSDRKKTVEMPLIPSYIFVKTTPKSFPLIYKTYGVVKVVSFEGKPVSIPQSQIDILRLLIDSNVEMEVTSENFANGDSVVVTGGALAGLTGELIRTGSSNRFIVRIDKLDQNIIINIPKAFLKKTAAADVAV
ncbi:MAG: UpxY family transcription antiterminator [Bacteroidales bacterium]|jgi:transcription antitermination factor NusG|nr:UpxY family transcription antiterminator [Bacteroidales bacterium]